LAGESEHKPFRSELELEKTPLFVTSKYKGDSWEYCRTLTNPDTGERVEQRVRVGKKHPRDRPRGVLTQMHQEVFYKLLWLWGESGYEVMLPGGTDNVSAGAEDVKRAIGYFDISPYALVRFVFGEDGGLQYGRLRSLLADLVGIPIVREYHYLQRGTFSVDEFTLLSGADWKGRQIDRKTGTPRRDGSSEVHIQFSEAVTRNFLDKQIKSLLLGVYTSIGADRRGRRLEIARLLYPLLDYELYGKPEYHCKLAALFQRLGCRSYKYKSKRREKILAAVGALDGLPILGEQYRLRIKLTEAEDGSDWVLVAWRDAQERLPFGD
jgi:hypothetical protein